METPLMERRREINRNVWLVYSVTGMVIDAMLYACNPWFTGKRGYGAQLADQMMAQFKERFTEDD